MGFEALIGGALFEGVGDAAVAGAVGAGIGDATAAGAIGAGIGDATAAGAIGAGIGDATVAGAAGAAGGAALGSAAGFGESALSAGFGDATASDFAGGGAGGAAGLSPDTLSALGASSGGFDEAGFAGGNLTGDFGAGAGSFDETGFAGGDLTGGVTGLDYSGEAEGSEFLANNEPTDPWSAEQTTNYLNQFGDKGGVPDQPTATTQQDVVDQTVAQDPANQNPAARGTGSANGAAGTAAATGKGGLGAFNPGSLLSSLMQLGKGVPHPGSLDQNNAAASALAAQGNLLIGQYNQGVLSGPMMAQIKLGLQGTINKIRQTYASQGRSNSTDRIQAENLATTQAAAGMAQALAQELQQGLGALGTAGQLFMSQANAEIQASNAYNASLNSALGNILKLPIGGSSGGFVPSQSQNSIQGGDVTGGGGEGGGGATDFAEASA